MTNMKGHLLSVMSIVSLSIAAQTSVNPPLALSGAETQAAYAVNLSSGDVIYDYHGDRKLTPASITKLFSTGAALIQKRPEGRIQTNIGLVPDSSMLVVHAAFDPTTDSRYFNKNQLSLVADTLADCLKALGHDHLTKLTADLSLGLFSPYCSRRLWEDMGNYYGASPSALMADDNAVDVYFSSPNKTDELCTIDSIVPNIGGRMPINYVRSYNGNSDLSNMYMAGNDLWYTTGCIPKGRRAFCVRSAMPEPEQHYMDKLASLLRARGIQIDTITYEKDRVSGRKDSTIMSVWSPKIKDIVATTNTWSVNLFADALAFNLSARWSHATWSGATEGIKSFWNKQIGITPSIYDGSGLSPMGALAPKDLTALLAYMHNQDVDSVFYESLPILGKTGTLRNVGKSSVLKGKVRAKSGSMTGVIAYAGYIEKNPNEKIAFCIIINHHQESTSSVRTAIVNWLVTLTS